MTLLSEASLISRQNMYKTYVNCDESKLQAAERVKDEIIAILDEHKGWSGAMIHKELTARGIKIGRDKFYRIINRYKLTLNSKKKVWRKRHRPVKPAKNLIINHTFHRVFEVLFSDYTEIETEEGKLQLLLLEDLVSRYITSYRISNTCTAAPVVEALEESMSLKSSLGLRYSTIFHTDRGSEFVNHAVKNLAIKHDLKISNTGKYHCYENPYMESLNRTLKHSLGLRVKFPTKEAAEEQIANAIKQYNYEHQHSSIGKRVPYSILTSYTGKNRGKPEVFQCAEATLGRGGRTYTKSLIVKVKKIGLDK